jgi:hypothetical protein
MALDARFGREIADAVRLLQGSASPGAVDIDRLPPQVRAFAERAVAESPEIPDTVELEQDAELRLDQNGEWLPIDAHHTASIRASGLVWRASASMAPLVSMKAYDAFVGGDGRLVVRLLGAFPVTDASGPEVSRGEAMRYLAELPWTPHAILANSALSWRVIEERVVEVSTESAGGTASVRLTFDEAGDIVTAEADDRPRDDGGAMVPTRWRGTFSDYGLVGGVRLPRRAEVSWILEGGINAYFRAEIIGVELR